MTKLELMSLQHLDVAEQKRLIHLHSEEGWLICNFTEGMDIMDYASTNCLYVPVKDEYIETYSTITVEQDAIYRGMQDAEIERMNAELQAE